jgi:hypothetical protein
VDEEQKRDAALTAARTAANVVIAKAAERLGESVQRAMTAQITRHQKSQTAQLQDSDLADLKADLAAFVAGLSASVATWLDDEKLWLHRGYTEDHRWPIASADDEAGPAPLADAIAAGARQPLETLIEAYDYVGKDKDLGTRFSWRGAPNAAVVAYLATARALRAANSALRAALEAKAIREASTRWANA